MTERTTIAVTPQTQRAFRRLQHEVGVDTLMEIVALAALALSTPEGIALLRQAHESIERA